LKARIAIIASLAVAASASVACRQVAGINPIVYQGSEGGTTGGCTNATAVVSTTDELDFLQVASGFVSAIVVGGSGDDTNVIACPTSTPCTQPQGLLSLGFNDALGGYAAGSKLTYTISSTAANASSLHTIDFTGSGDTTVLGSLAAASFVAVSGAKIFWIDSDPNSASANVHCVGCGASDTMWVTGLSSPEGIWADASNVYFLDDDGSGLGTDAVFGCSVNTACNGTPRVVLKNLSPTATRPIVQFASDGANVYASNDASQIIRVDPSNAQTTVANSVAATAIAVDATTGDLFYGEDDGTVGVTKADGSGTPTVLSSCVPSEPDDIYGVAFDATNVYVLIFKSDNTSAVYAMKR